MTGGDSERLGKAFLERGQGDASDGRFKYSRDSRRIHHRLIQGRLARLAGGVDDDHRSPRIGDQYHRLSRTEDCIEMETTGMSFWGR